MPTAGHSAAEARAPSAPGEAASRRTLWLSRLWPGGLSDVAIAIPLVAMLILLVFWAGDQGGFPATVWYPGALITLWLLVICVFDRRYSLRLREWRTAALAFFALFTLWSFLSIIWAEVRGDAWDGANQTLFYLTVFALFSRWRMNARVAALFVSLYAIAVAALGLITIELAVHGGHPASILFGSRLSSPIDYPNGEAGLFLIPLWPVLYLVSRKELPPLVRGLLAASAGLLLQMAVLAQSRGSMYAFPIVFLLFITLVSGRGRALASALAVIAVSALNLSRLLDVFQAGDRHDGSLANALTQARNGMLITFVVLLVLGTLAAVLDGRAGLSERLAHRLDRGLVTGFGLAVVLAASITVVSVGHPIRHIDTAWHNFSTGAEGDSSSSHFISFYGTHRYDFWRVSVDEFRAHPVGGVGANNFAVEYLRLGRSDEQPANPHSIEFKVLLQTGAIGALLFVSFIASALMATRRKKKKKKKDSFRDGLAASLVVGFAYWLVHGSVDWFWELPALATVAFAFLGLSAALSTGERDGERAVAGRPRGTLLVVPLAIVATLSYAGPWLSARYTDAASRVWRTDPALASQQLDRARSIDPLSDTPDLIAGTIAGRRLDYAGMRKAYERALARNPVGWYAHFELGMAEYLLGNQREARVHLRRARQLDPREPLISEIINRVRLRRTIDLTEVNDAFLTHALELGGGAH
ncbi:MAG: O-antigen ligase family protein [Gaiellaceae bacterium]